MSIVRYVHPCAKIKSQTCWQMFGSMHCVYLWKICIFGKQQYNKESMAPWSHGKQAQKVQRGFDGPPWTSMGLHRLPRASTGLQRLQNAPGPQGPTSWIKAGAQCDGAGPSSSQRPMASHGLSSKGKDLFQRFCSDDTYDAYL